MGVTKAYATRVGLGPFPTELTGAEGDSLRDQGAEFGATTGRPRRCGWLDGLALRHAARINGLDSLAVTKLDVLSGLKTLKVATAYETAGGLLTEFPSRLEHLETAKPLYEEHPGWDGDLGRARTRDELPETARRFLHRIEEITDVPIRIISVGQARDQTITVAD
jgi:adenylosuccinate synthase